MARGITYIYCQWNGDETKLGMMAHPNKDTIDTLKQHLKQHVPSAKFIKAEYHNDNGFVFEYTTKPNTSFKF